VSIGVNNGGIVRRIETGDKLVLAFSEAIAPSSLTADCNGTGSQNVTIRQANNTNDTISVDNAMTTVRLPLGAVLMSQCSHRLHRLHRHPVRRGSHLTFGTRTTRAE